MKLTKQRLKEIIKEELTKWEWEGFKLKPEQKPFVLRFDGTSDYLLQLTRKGRGNWSADTVKDPEMAKRFEDIDRAMDVQSRLKEEALGLVEIIPLKSLLRDDDSAQTVKVSAPTDKKVDRLRRGLKTGRWRDLEEGEK